MIDSINLVGIRSRAQVKWNIEINIENYSNVIKHGTLQFTSYNCALQVLTTMVCECNVVEVENEYVWVSALWSMQK